MTDPLLVSAWHTPCRCVRVCADGKHVVFGRVAEGMHVVKKLEALGSRSGRTAKRCVIADCGELPSRRQLLAKVRAAKEEEARLRQEPQYVDADAESLARLKRLRGEGGQPAPPPGRAAVPVRTAQDELRELEEKERAEREAATAQPGSPAGAAAQAQQQQQQQQQQGGEGGEAPAYPMPPAPADPTEGMSARERRLWELRQKMGAARKANESAVVAEKRRQASGRGQQEGDGSDGSKRKWFEEKEKKKVRSAQAWWAACVSGGGGTAASLCRRCAAAPPCRSRPHARAFAQHTLPQEEELKRLGLKPEQAHRLDSAEVAEYRWKKAQKAPAPQGWWAPAGLELEATGRGGKGRGSSAGSCPCWSRTSPPPFPGNSRPPPGRPSTKPRSTAPTRSARRRSSRMWRVRPPPIPFLDFCSGMRL